MKKKGIIGQPFIYIFMVIVIAFIFLFGFRMISNLGDLNEKTIYLTFKSDFGKSVDSLYYKNAGSVLFFDKDSRNKPLRLPKDVEEVCFVENSKVKLPPWDSFDVDNLTGSGCIEVVDNQLSFKLENVVINGETFVQLSSI